MKKTSCIIWLLVFGFQLINAQSELAETKRLLEDIDDLTIGSQVKYNIHATDTTTGNIYRMDALHVMELKKAANISKHGRYVGVYHHKAGDLITSYEIHLATSNDLMNWTFHGVLLDSSDMPYIQRTTGEINEADSWILMAHEKWESGGTCKVAFKVYYTEDSLLNLNHTLSYKTPISFSDANLEGTPSIISAELLFRDARWVVDAEIGFHYNESNRDKVGFADLTGFGNTLSYDTYRVENYMNHITYQGATGNVGQRDNFSFDGINFLIQEGNIQGNPTANWEFGAWRLWLYKFDGSSGIPDPISSIDGMLRPEDFYFIPIFPRTHQRSTAFGNPSIQIVTHPSGTGKVLFAQYFIMSEGASHGEGGPMIFYKQLPEETTPSILKNSKSFSEFASQINGEFSTQGGVLEFDVVQNKNGELQYTIDTGGESCKVTIYTLNGSIVYSENVPEGMGRVENYVSINQKEVGDIFIVRVVSGSNSATKKVFIN